MSKSNQSLYFRPLGRWLYNQQRAMGFCFKELRQSPWASVIIIVVIGITLALPCALYQLLQQVETLTPHMNGSPQATLYLKDQVSVSKRNALIRQIRANDVIESVEYISPEQGLMQFQQFTQLDDVMSEFQDNPLPGVLTVIGKTHTDPHVLAAQFKKWQAQPEVASGRLDTVWIQRLYFLITLSQRIMYSLAGLFGLGVLLIIGNTIRLTLQRYHEEVEIMSVLGATPRFIRRPLLYSGMLYGLLGGVLSWLIVTSLLSWFSLPLNGFLTTYHHTGLSHRFDLAVAAKIIAVATLLGYIGSLFAVQAYLARQFKKQ